jgi:hypothetical protein
MAATADGQKTIAGIFGQEKVAQETIKMMSVLGLIDEEALAVSTIFIQPTVRPEERCTLLMHSLFIAEWIDEDGAR